jgi:hypothetical protein
MVHAESERDNPSTLVVTVVRTGGIAGMPQQWRAEPAADDAEKWRALVSACPWDDTPARAERGADRFVWRISADDDAGRHEAKVPDSALEGAWRNLVDAVRAAASGVSRTGPRASS